MGHRSFGSEPWVTFRNRDAASIRRLHELFRLNFLTIVVGIQLPATTSQRFPHVLNTRGGAKAVSPRGLGFHEYRSGNVCDRAAGPIFAATVLRRRVYRSPETDSAMFSVCSRTLA